MHCDYQTVRSTLLHPESVVQVLTGNLLIDRLLSKTQTVTEVLGVSPAEAERLAASRDWTIDFLAADYVRDPAKTREDAGLPPVPSHAPAPAVDPTQTLMCMVCTDDVSASDVFQLWCGHQFCKTCWSLHICGQIKEAKVPVRCMASDCHAHVSSFDLPTLGMSAEDVTSFRCVA